MKRLSERKGFRTALLLTANHSSNPSVNGYAEVGVRWLKSKIQVWVWIEEMGSDVITELPPTASWRDIVNAVLYDERFSVSENSYGIHISGDRPPLGQLLSLAWSESDDDKNAADLLLHLSDDTLERLSMKRKGGLLADPLLGLCSEISNSLDDLSVGRDDLDFDIVIKKADIASVRSAFLSRLSEIAKAQDEADAIEEAAKAARESKLAPFKDEISKVYQVWYQDQPRSRYPGAGLMPPFGAARFDRFLEDYVLEHKTLPIGTHTIPGGGSFMGRVGVEFEVDFDALNQRVVNSDRTTII